MDSSCFQWFKDTNLKANHNYDKILNLHFEAAFNSSNLSFL